MQAKSWAASAAIVLGCSVVGQAHAQSSSIECPDRTAAQLEQEVRDYFVRRAAWRPGDWMAPNFDAAHKFLPEQYSYASQGGRRPGIWTVPVEMTDKQGKPVTYGIKLDCRGYVEFSVLKHQ